MYWALFMFFVLHIFYIYALLFLLLACLEYHLHLLLYMSDFLRHNPLLFIFLDL